MADCTELKCTVPGVYDYEIAETLELLLDYDGEDDVSILTEDGIPVLI